MAKRYEIPALKWRKVDQNYYVAFSLHMKFERMVIFNGTHHVQASYGGNTFRSQACRSWPATIKWANKVNREVIGSALKEVPDAK